MASFYLQYNIEKIIGYPEVRALIDEFVFVGGVKIPSLFASTVTGGFNVVRLVGMSTQTPSFKDSGFSSDAVGRTYWQYSSVKIPDGADIPSQYNKSPAPVVPSGEIGSVFTSQPTELATSSSLKYSGGKLLTATGSASIDALSEIASNGYMSAVKNVFKYQADKLGLGALAESISKVQTVASALTKVHENAGYVIEEMFKNKNMDAAEVAVLVDTLLLNSQATLFRAAEKVTGGPEATSALLKATGYSAEIVRSATSAVGSEIKFKVYSGNAVQLESGYANERYTDSLFVLDGAESSSMFGRASNDVLAGGEGSDSFWGGGGDDALVGGSGTDSAGYVGPRANYTITSSSSGFRVTDKTGKEGSDALVGVERLYFSDGNVALDVAGTAGKAYRLYQAAFDRKPDQAGLGYQLQQLDYGAPLSAVAQNFINSPEFSRTYGALTNVQFVTQLYRNVLHRDADAAGLAFHTGNLASAANTRANVLIGFSESPENQAAVIGSIQFGMAYQFP